MLTQNFNNLNALVYKCGSSTTNWNNFIFKSTGGTEVNAAASDVSYYGRSIKIVLGDDDTGETLEDYALGNEINGLTVISSGNDLPPISGSSTTIRYDKYDKFHFVTATLSVRNDTASPITVREVAIYANVTSSTSTFVMFSRNVISPVTIGVGEQKAFSVTIGDE